MYRVWNFVTTYSVLLILGAGIALIWANTHYDSYHHMVEFPIWFNDLIGADFDYWKKVYGEGYDKYDAGGATKVLSFHYLVNDILMAFFFAIAAKEVWEAIILKNGSLRGKKAATPLFATAGGMIGPAAVYLGLAAFLGSDTYDAVARGWAIPTATDIAFSYLVGRLVFGAGHPAVRFLLLLAIADDAAGLIILAVVYTDPEALAPSWLLLSIAASIAVYVLANWLPRRLDRGNQDRPTSTWVREKLGWWPYAIAGVFCWYGFAQSGVHPVLGLVPIVLTIPHADRAFGIFSEAEQYLTDLLNQIEHALKHPVEIILFFFGLLNAGVVFSSMGSPTWLVLAGLLIGKPLGILLFGWVAARPLGLGLPQGMRIIDLFVIGCVAAIGFTVSLFFATVAFSIDDTLFGLSVQEAAKMGALFSFFAAIVSIIAGIVTRVEKQHA